MWLIGVICTFVHLIATLISPISSSYAMYVWRNGWDPSISGCANNLTAFYAWDDTPSSPCFTHTWSTQEKRDWLWSTCNRPGREISQIFFYDTVTALSTRDCSSTGVQWVKSTMAEGHRKVQGLKIYALFSDGGESVPEQSHVPHIVWYNTECANAALGEQIDGVAVNNENWDVTWDSVRMARYLDNLNRIVINAHTQEPVGSLKTHFSVGWRWGKSGNGGDIVITWGGKSQPVMRHFIDIFDSIDVQVAFVTSDAMEDRLRGAEWDYAVQQGKSLLTTAYINKALPCQTTYFPFPINDLDCPAWAYDYKTESMMFQELDAFQSRIPSRVVLHHFRGAYSSGGIPDWPKH